MCSRFNLNEGDFMEKMGIKETMELLDLAEHVAVKTVEASRDGLGVEDLTKLIDPQLWVKGRAAIAGVDQVGGEMKDLSIAEVRQLSDRVLQMVEKLLVAAKKPEAPVA
jgi:hypothetical protein